MNNEQQPATGARPEALSCSHPFDHNNNSLILSFYWHDEYGYYCVHYADGQHLCIPNFW